MSRKVHTEWRKNEREVDLLSGEGTVLVAVETFWYEESMTAPWGSTTATHTWMELDDGVEPRWYLDGKPVTRDAVAALIGEEETDKTLEGE